MRAAGGEIVLVSLGDAEKLAKFLELNPDIPSSIARVDDSKDFALYEACGFGKFTDATTKPKLQSPNFSFGDWFKYLSNVAKLAPIREGERGVPEGVLRLGGTFVLRGDDVVYAHAEALPGAHADVDDVLRAAAVGAQSAPL